MPIIMCGYCDFVIPIENPENFIACWNEMLNHEKIKHKEDIEEDERIKRDGF